MTGLRVKTSKFLFQRSIKAAGNHKRECELLGITTVSGEPERRDAFRVP